MPIKLVHVMTVPQSLELIAGSIDFARSNGMEVHAVSSPGDWLRDFGSRHGIAVHAIPMARRISPLADFGALLRLTRLLRVLHPQIVHAHTPKGGLLGIVAATLARVPVRIYHLRGLLTVTAKGLRRRVFHGAEWVSCRLAHQVVCQSHSLRDLALREGLCDPDRASVLLRGSNGVDALGRFDPGAYPEARRSLRESLGIPLEGPVKLI